MRRFRSPTEHTSQDHECTAVHRERSESGRASGPLQHVDTAAAIFSYCIKVLVCHGFGGREADPSYGLWNRDLNSDHNQRMAVPPSIYSHLLYRAVSSNQDAQGPQRAICQARWCLRCEESEDTGHHPGSRRREPVLRPTSALNC